MATPRHSQGWIPLGFDPYPPSDLIALKVLYQSISFLLCNDQTIISKSDSGGHLFWFGVTIILLLHHPLLQLET